MRINVAGAGAGKTTKMADYITEFEIPTGKIVFCISFTNAAAENIEEKVKQKLDNIPSNIRISTIHSFLYQELICPYYYFLYGKQFAKLSTINLPANAQFKRAKLSELEKNDILHYTSIPEKAKWIAYQKTGDTRAVKESRNRLLEQFQNYCAAIFIDEAQDISKDVFHIIEALDKRGVPIILYGDPKQDIKGYGYFRSLIEKTSDVTYISECHRCPQKHLDLSNTLAPTEERQIADQTKAEGHVDTVYESDIANVKQFICDGDFGLRFISKKQDRFATHEGQENNKRLDTVYHEIQGAIKLKWLGKRSNLEIDRFAYYISEKLIEAYDEQENPSRLISSYVMKGFFDSLPRQQYAQLMDALKKSKESSPDAVVIKSIEAVKGLEAEKCLFILTLDLAPYLFGQRVEDNKTSHLLYVALTRSLNSLSILVTKEVEKKYNREVIKKYLE